MKTGDAKNSYYFETTGVHIGRIGMGIILSSIVNFFNYLSKFFKNYNGKFTFENSQ
jgi:hypothetical protein